MSAEHWIDLWCHPSTRTEMVRAIQVLVRRAVGGELKITYRLDGDLGRIRAGRPAAPRIGTELWRHTCLEAFIAVEGQASYHEFNFAPTGEWAVYVLSGYRIGGQVVDEAMRPEIAVRSTRDRLELDAIVRLDRLSAMHPRADLRVGLSAVIEANDGISYWALRHFGDKADFHNADGFALLLEPPCADE